MFTYERFLAFSKKNELARQNRFDAFIGTPPIMYGNYLRDVFCKSVMIGGVNVASDPVRLTGEMIEVPYDRTFSNITLTMYTDIDLKVRRYFDAWVEGIQGTRNRVLSFYRQYTTNITVYVLDKNNVPRYKINCFECWPKTIGSLSLDNELAGFMFFDVTFEFRYYVTNLLQVDDYSPRQMLSPTVVSTVGGANTQGINDYSSMRQVILNNPGDLGAYVNDPSAMNIIANDPLSMAAIAESSAAKEALWESDSALAAVGESPTGWAALRGASLHSIVGIPNLVMGGVNTAFDTYQGAKYITTGISLDITEGQDTLIRLNDLRNGSISPSSLSAATQGVSNSTGALGKLVAPINGPASVTPEGDNISGATAFLGLLRV